jgi:hypothetical protein
MPIRDNTTLQDISPDRQDIREFRRLRNYYRRTRKHGESDECFVTWIDLMAAGERDRQLVAPIRTTRGGRCPRGR